VKANAKLQQPEGGGGMEAQPTCNREEEHSRGMGHTTHGQTAATWVAEQINNKLVKRDTVVTRHSPMEPETNGLL
jgi:hypothetical protein